MSEAGAGKKLRADGSVFVKKGRGGKRTLTAEVKEHVWSLRCGAQMVERITGWKGWGPNTTTTECPNGRTCSKDLSNSLVFSVFSV